MSLSVSVSAETIYPFIDSDVSPAYDDHTDYYILDPDFSSANGKATVTTYGTPNTSHNYFVYKTNYTNRNESQQHEYKWKYTRY